MLLKSHYCISLGLLLGSVSLLESPHVGHTGAQITTISEQVIDETLNGEAVKVVTIEVAYGPGESSPPHRHAGPIFGYVLEGEFESALRDEQPRIYKAGETFYEPKGVLHRVSRNPQKTARTRVLAIMLPPKNCQELTVSP